jgi:hypothetical protein
LFRHGNGGEVKKVEAQMTKVKNDFFEKIRSPNMFYCTFEKELAYRGILEIKKL